VGGRNRRRVRHAAHAAPNSRIPMANDESRGIHAFDCRGVCRSGSHGQALYSIALYSQRCPGDSDFGCGGFSRNERMRSSSRRFGMENGQPPQAGATRLSNSWTFRTSAVRLAAPAPTEFVMVLGIGNSFGSRILRSWLGTINAQHPRATPTRNTHAQHPRATATGELAGTGPGEHVRRVLEDQSD